MSDDLRQRDLWLDGSRWRNIVEFLEHSGPNGATLDELDRARVCPIQSACGLVLQLRRSGRFIHTGETRLTRLGRPARVFVLRKFAKLAKKDKEAKTNG